MNTELQTAIESELSKEQENPFAVFDFDNTCIAHDIAEATLAYMCENKLLKNKRLLPDVAEDADSYHELVFRHYYRLLETGDILTAYHFCAQAFAGFTPEETDAIVHEAIQAEGEVIGERLLYGITIAHGLAPREQVKELLDFLVSKNVAIWIVSASPEAAVRGAMRAFSIPGKLIGLRNKVENSVLTDEITEPYSIAEGKVACIQTYIQKEQRPLLGIGDSMNDFPMLQYSAIPVVLDRGNALSKEADERGWIKL